MSKHAKSFSEVEQVSKTFKNQPVEVYVQRDKIFIGFKDKFYAGRVAYKLFENSKFLCPDIMVTEIGDLAPFRETSVIQMVTDGEQYSINDPEYVHKRFIWDTEDCIEGHHSDLRPGDIIRADKGFLLYLGEKDVLGEQKHLILNLEENIPRLVDVERLKGLKVYRHRTLWERKC